ncbi:hypothetical protein HD554DRAFT_2228582 [Boletus coccyginus]|nr:hypothetical protein HD554DRAFT_2228582 [Boletus coccyginus]
MIREWWTSLRWTRRVHEDLRILIMLDIIVGSMKLHDQFNLNGTSIPGTVCRNPGGEFKTAIAHLIVYGSKYRCKQWTKILQSFLPILNYLSDGEIEQNKNEPEKELTKRQRQNMRGCRGIASAAAFPDREPNRTYWHYPCNRLPWAGSCSVLLVTHPIIVKFDVNITVLTCSLDSEKVAQVQINRAAVQAAPIGIINCNINAYYARDSRKVCTTGFFV